MPRHVILGAGVAGLASALTLIRRGQTDVLILEKQPGPGGHCRSVEWQGCTLDLGPHRLLITVPRVERFILDLLGGELLQVQRKSRMYLLGRWMDYPPRPLEIARVLGLWRGLSLLAGHLTRGSAVRRRGYTPETYAGYISARFGTGMYDLLFRDYARKVWREEPESLDADVARIRLTSQGLLDTILDLFRRRSAHAALDLLYPKSGIGALPRAMVSEINEAGGRIECGATPVSVGHARGGNPAVEYRVGDRTRTVGYDCLTSTIPLPTLVSLLQPPPPEEVVTAAASLRFSAVRFAALLISRPRVSENLWMYLPDPSLRISRLYEVGNFSKDLVPKGKSCLVVEVPCSVGDPDWRLQEKHLIRKVIDDLARTGLVTQNEIEAGRVMSLPDAYPVYHLGYRKQIDTCCDFLRTVPGLISTGRQGLFCYNNADHSIDMGIRAAEIAAEGAEGTSGFYDLREEFSQYRIVD